MHKQAQRLTCTFFGAEMPLSLPLAAAAAESAHQLGADGGDVSTDDADDDVHAGDCRRALCCAARATRGARPTDEAAPAHIDNASTPFAAA